MRYKEYVFDYDWEEITSLLSNEDTFEEISDDLDSDFLILRLDKDVPWVEVPDDEPLEGTRLYEVKSEEEGYVEYMLVHDGDILYTSEFPEDL